MAMFSTSQESDSFPAVTGEFAHLTFVCICSLALVSLQWRKNQTSLYIKQGSQTAVT